jgi:putative endonuclease
MFTVYILYSERFGKTYVGFTTDIEQRLRSHNELATKGYTVRYRPWELLHNEQFGSKQEAMAREKHFKSGLGREWIKSNLLKNQ